MVAQIISAFAQERPPQILWAGDNCGQSIEAERAI